MRALKLIGIGALVLALTVPSWGLTYNTPYNGPVTLHIASCDSGSVYIAGPGVYNPPPASPFPVLNPKVAGETLWGVLRVDSIHASTAIGPNNIVNIPGTTIWTKGVTDGTELVGIFWGEHDTQITIDALGNQVEEGTNLSFALWEQPFGTYNNGLLGTAARTGPFAYPTVGIPGGVGGATLVLTGTAEIGFVGTLPTTTFTGSFNPNAGPGDTAGSSTFFLSLGPNAAGLGVLNSQFDSNFYNVTGPTADVKVQATIFSNNPLNTPGALGGFDWTVTDSDPVTMISQVPEPVTIMGLLFSVAAVGGYVRRRRLA